MSITNELSVLINDSVSNKVALFNEGAAKYTDQAVREGFFEVLGDNKLTWQGWRRHNIECYEIMENVLNVNIPLAWDNSPFYSQFVETKNGRYGDTNEFVIDDDGYLFCSTFSGGHWDVERQKIQGKKAFSLTQEWIAIRVYDELDRFLKGTITLAEMVAKLQKAFQDDIDSRIYTSFNGIGTYLPAKFQETGAYDRDTMSDLIERVTTASQKSVVLAGTRSALSHIVEGVEASRMSANQKEELATTGALLNLTGLGVSCILIPQVFMRGTYDFKVNNNTIYVLPEGTKPVKLYFEGDTRARETNEKDNRDQTIDTTVQTKLGTGIIVDSLIGKYTIV